MGKFINALAEQMGSAALGLIPQAANAGLGMMLGRSQERHNDERQIRQQRALQDMQMQGNMEMMKYGKELDYEMWLKTNYEAQMKELRKAGLNPALLYGMGGQGGMTTGGSAPGVGGGHAPSGGGEAMGMSIEAMRMNMQMQQAQLENLKANTKKTEAEAEKTAGVDTGVARTQILKGFAEIDDINARRQLTEVETRLAKLQEQVQGRTVEDAIRNIQWTSEKTYEQLVQARYESNIVEETWRTKVAQAKADLANTYAETVLKKVSAAKGLSDIEVNRQGMIESANRITQKWLEIEYNGRRMTTEEKKAQHEMWVRDMQESVKAPLEIIEQMVDGIWRMK